MPLATVSLNHMRCSRVAPANCFARHVIDLFLLNAYKRSRTLWGIVACGLICHSSKCQTMRRIPLNSQVKAPLAFAIEWKLSTIRGPLVIPECDRSDLGSSCRCNNTPFAFSMYIH